MARGGSSSGCGQRPGSSFNVCGGGRYAEAASAPPTTTSTNYTTTTTTTAAPGAPGREPAEDLKRPITSPVTAALLLTLLESGWATTEMLAEEVERLTGRRMRAKDLLRYLRYYQQKGWVTSASPLWSLTDEGRCFVLKYERWLRRLVGDLSQKPTVGESFVWHTEPDGTVSYGIPKTAKERLNDVIDRLRPYLRNGDEEAVLRVLVANYLETGSTYMYVDELAEELESSPSWLYQHVLRRMRGRGLIYVWRDGKVGLGRLVRRVLGALAPPGGGGSNSSSIGWGGLAPRSRGASEASGQTGGRREPAGGRHNGYG